MKIKTLLPAIAVALTSFVQPALADWTFDKNGEPAHYKGIALEPIPTVEQARAATEKRLAAIKAEEGKQAAESEAARATAPQELILHRQTIPRRNRAVSVPLPALRPRAGPLDHRRPERLSRWGE